MICPGKHQQISPCNDRLFLLPPCWCSAGVEKTCNYSMHRRASTKHRNQNFVGVPWVSFNLSSHDLSRKTPANIPCNDRLFLLPIASRTLSLSKAASPTKTAHESSSLIFRTLPAIVHRLTQRFFWYEKIRPSHSDPCNHRTLFWLQIFRSIRSAGQKK